jgi:hypothetical protein
MHAIFLDDSLRSLVRLCLFCASCCYCPRDADTDADGVGLADRLGEGLTEPLGAIDGDGVGWGVAELLDGCAELAADGRGCAGTLGTSLRALGAADADVVVPV